jgi:hypothetical protein
MRHADHDYASRKLEDPRAFAGCESKSPRADLLAPQQRLTSPPMVPPCPVCRVSDPFLSLKKMLRDPEDFVKQKYKIAHYCRMLETSPLPHTEIWMRRAPISTARPRIAVI